jgi:hypothetical protein
MYQNDIRKRKWSVDDALACGLRVSHGTENQMEESDKIFDRAEDEKKEEGREREREREREKEKKR